MTIRIAKETKKNFANAQTLGELRNVYLEAMLRYKAPKSLEQLNGLYISKFDDVKNVRRNKKGEIYDKEWTETASFFLNAVQVFKELEGIEFKAEGEWIWVTGDTKPVKDALKGAGCHYSAKCKAWFIEG